METYEEKGNIFLLRMLEACVTANPSVSLSHFFQTQSPDDISKRKLTCVLRKWTNYSF